MHPVLLVLIACHFIGDFAFQSAWMASEKAKSDEILMYHVATYVAPFVLFSPLGLPMLIVLFVMHLIIDAFKCAGIIKNIWLDQALHILVLVILAAIGV